MGGSSFGVFGSQATAEELAEAGILDREKGIEKRAPGYDRGDFF